MKRLFIALIILTVCTVQLLSLNQSDFDSKVDFSITLKKLSALIEQGRVNQAPIQKFIIISGTISNVAILDETEAGYLIEVELTEGEWINVEEVKSYQVLIRFSGFEFQKYFNKQKGNQAPEEKIEINSTVLIVAKILNTTNTRSGKKVWLLQGFYVRKLK
ncbi:MAG: hypothetical protein JW822_05940 [Spirochaetales bacterium]|nr:hypothetical protein [Spirochaetales bacterium]